MKRYAFFLLAAFSLAFLTGCSGDDDDVIVTPDAEDTLRVEETIGSEGGTIEITGQVVLEIPADALSDSIEFAIEEMTSPAPIDPPLCFMSPCYCIEPSGTVFDSSAELSITYHVSLLSGGAVEDSIVLYAFVDTMWEPLVTTVDTLNNVVTALISHLSEFAAAADTTSPPPPPVYAELYVTRTFMHNSTEGDTMDVMSASLNSGYSLAGPYAPLQADSVKCNEFSLPWDLNAERYVYEDTDIIELDSNYSFFVYGNEDVPDLETSILFPDRQPDITSPTYDQVVPYSGFTVTWSDFGGGGQVELILGDSAGVVFDINVPNNGNYAVNEANYDRPPGPDVDLLLIFENRDQIDAEGYDSESFVAGRVVSTTSFRLESE